MSERIPNRIQEALSALRNEQYARAVAIADQLAEEVPENPMVRAIRAQGLLNSDDPKAAFDEAQEAAKLDPANAHAQALLGYAAWRTERPGMAQSAFERAVRLSDRNPFFLGEYAWFMANERPPKAAETAAQEAVDADRSSSTAWAALGLAQFRMRQRTDAEASLRRALELNPNDIYAQSAMIALLQEQGQDDQAAAMAASLKKHRGAEDLADSVREEAKRRKLAAMLLERNIDIDATPTDNSNLFWIGVIAAGVVCGAILFYLNPRRPLPAILFAVVPPVLIWLYLRVWD